MFYVDTIGEHITVKDFNKGLEYIKNASVNGEDVEGWVVCYLPNDVDLE